MILSWYANLTYS